MRVNRSRKQVPATPPASAGPGSRPGLTAAEVRAGVTSSGPIELSPEDAARADAAIADAEADLGGREDARVNFRWERAPLAVIQRAAALSGVPYQTWIKQALYRHAIAELAAAAAVDPRARA